MTARLATVADWPAYDAAIHTLPSVPVYYEAGWEEMLEREVITTDGTGFAHHVWDEANQELVLLYPIPIGHPIPALWELIEVGILKAYQRRPVQWPWRTAGGTRAAQRAWTSWRGWNTLPTADRLRPSRDPENGQHILSWAPAAAERVARRRLR